MQYFASYTDSNITDSIARWVNSEQHLTWPDVTRRWWPPRHPVSFPQSYKTEMQRTAEKVKDGKQSIKAPSAIVCVFFWPPQNSKALLLSCPPQHSKALHYVLWRLGMAGIIHRQQYHRQHCQISQFEATFDMTRCNPSMVTSKTSGVISSVIQNWNAKDRRESERRQTID